MWEIALSPEVSTDRVKIEIVTIKSNSNSPVRYQVFSNIQVQCLVERSWDRSFSRRAVCNTLLNALEMSRQQVATIIGNQKMMIVRRVGLEPEGVFRHFRRVELSGRRTKI